MATTVFQSVGLEFVPNNYAAPLSTENAPEAFHLLQNFLAQSDIGQALVEPAKLYGSQIKAFWETGVYDDGGESGTPSIVFEFDEQEFVVTPTIVRDALGFEDFNAYTIFVGDAELQRMMREIGYSGSLARTGNLKRPLLRKEWSFFFDYITREFGKKCTNWDAIPIDSLQIGYSLLYGNNFDFARLILNNIGEKMTENRSVVYFARFCQLIFSTCVDGVEIAEDDVIPSFRLHKRIFSDLTNKDIKKGNVGELLLPASVQQFLQPQPESEQPLNTEPLSTISPKPKAGGRTKHRAFKAVKATKPSNADDLPKSVGISRTKKRENRPTTDENRASDENESIHTKKRKLVAAYLFDGLIPDSTTAAVPEVIIEDISENATVPEEARANTDDNVAFNDDFLEPILEMDIEENIEAHPSATLEEFGSVGETEDVAADQPTVIIDESLATHTEVFSVTHQVIEKGEEVDQTSKTVATEGILEDAAEKVFEATAEPAVEAVQETVVENLNSKKLVNEDAQETFAENIPNSLSKESTAKSDDQADSSSSTRVSGQNIPKVTDIGGTSNYATEAHFQDMYFANWSNKYCIFTDRRATDFVTKSAATITNSELLTHFKATIVQVKSLHNHFDETQKSVTGLRNDVVARDMSLKQDKSMLLSLVKDQDVLKNRLSKVEDNQIVMSDKLDSIAASLEFLTSVLIPDDVKKGERVLKDKCKKSQTLSRQDDTTDGGAKGKEIRTKSIQEQGRLRSNSARVNSEGVNTGAQSSSKAKSLLLSSQPNTDEEIAAQLFLKEHGADATIKDIQAEEKMLAEEHEKNLKSGKVKKVVKVSRPKEKGIVIKENVNSQQSLQYSRRPVEANVDKGKGKLVEETQIFKKAKSTSDNAQVVKSLEAVTTTDSTQVVQTLISSELQRTFAKPVTVQHSLIPGNVNILQSKTIMGKESRDKSGLGSHREKRVNNSPMDQTSLAEPGVGVTQENLDTLESVQLIHHRGLKKDFLVYFKADGRVYRVGEADIGLKMKEELEYVLYLLKIKNQRTHQADEVLRSRMMKTRALCGLKSAGSYIPKYRDYNGKLVEMQRNSARLRTDLGIKVLEFNLESDKSFIIKLGNEMRKNSIYALRAAIYQTGESDPELKELKKIMVAELERDERRLLMDYIKTVPDIEEIK
ncbi:hypothetical protein POM88_027391 [Heracleum sosnowskyi]|uniref:Uncharacterized protein n=1 Tax=Heracleum sosnowskyi TaxID=360622 RepID=A0AAD8I7J0_9APIA|nr:hypothetical protein POM88_027391 [Heracleum sosnowskyi]